MTQGETTAPIPTLITSSEIAELAGVTPGAVSNWKRRHKSFPIEAEDGLYQRSDVVEWLESQGKEIAVREQSTEEVVWALADAVRGVVRMAELPEILLQLFALRAADADLKRLGALQGGWNKLRNAPTDQTLYVYRSLVESAESTDPNLARAMRMGSAGASLGGADWQRIVSLVDTLDPSNTDWGRAGSALIEGAVERLRTSAGEYSSGSSLVALLMAVLEPIEGTIYDPACGAAMFLSAVHEEHAPDVDRLLGQEVNEASWRLGFLHLTLLDAEFELTTGDTLVDDQHWQLRADRIGLEPPLNLKLRSIESLESDARWTWGVPQSSADLLWVQHVAFHLNDKGLGAVVVTPGALFRGPSSEIAIRKGLLRDDLVDGVVQLPPGMLGSTNASAALVLLARNKDNRAGKILFVDARHLGTPARSGLRHITSSDLNRIRSLIAHWREGEFEPEHQFSGAATVEEVSVENAELLPTRYIDYAELITEIDGEPIGERFTRLSAVAADKLSGLVSESGRLDELKTEVQVGLGDSLTKTRLGDLLVAPPTPGLRQKDDEPGDSIPFVPTSAVSGQAAVLHSPPRETTTVDPGDRVVQRDDLLLVRRGVERNELVPCAIVKFDESATFSSSLIRLRVDAHRVSPDYLRLYLTSRQGSAALAAAATGSVISNLRREALEEIQLYLPDLTAQKQVVAHMERLGEQIQGLDEAVETLRGLFDTMREGLLSGSLEPFGPGNDEGATR